MNKTIPLPEQGQLLIAVADYVNDVLGKSKQVDEDSFLNDLDYTSIPYDRAEAIYAVTQNRHTCFIQFPSEDCPELKQPLLWNYSAWVASIERYRKDKERSERERVQRWLQEENIKRLRRAILKVFQLDESKANMMATRAILTNDQRYITMFPITLLTKKEELP